MLNHSSYLKLGNIFKVSQLNIDSIIVRPEGWEAVSDEAYDLLSTTSSGYVYRGMTALEYENTVGSGNPIKSTGDYSFDFEGTSFTDDPGTAEGYVNFGRDDPRKTGISNYMVEVMRTDSMYLDRDGYIKDKEPVPLSAVTAIWEFSVDDSGNLWMNRV